MPPRLVARLALFACLALPVAAHATNNFWPASASTSTHLGWSVTGSANGHDEVADGANGFFVASDDGYGGHVQHVLANGSLAWPWYVYQPPGATGGYGNPSIALDGSGGVLVAYETHGGGDDLRVVRVTAAGALASDWPTAGLPVCPSSDYDYLSDIVGDGQGGAFVAFIRSGPYRVYVQHVLGNGKLDSSWPVNGVAVQEAGQTYSAPQILPDGVGGVMIFYSGTPYGPTQLIASRVSRDGVKQTDLFPGSGLALSPGSTTTVEAVRTEDGLFGVVWTDARTGTHQVYIDVLDNTGRTGFAPSQGLALSSGPSGGLWPAIATNAYRDFLVTWVSGNQIVGARRQQDLSVHPSFPAGSVVMATATSPYVHHPAVASDGGEGLVVAWRDPNEYSVLRSQRLTGSGNVPAGWSAGGQVIATSIGYVGDYPSVFSDGDGGVIALFSDYGSLSVNRLRRNGAHGLLVPAVFTALVDVPVDQGGKLSVFWRASEADTTPMNTVGSYMLWRQLTAPFAQARLTGGARVVAEGESPSATDSDAIRVLSSGTTTTYWEYLGSTPARGWAGYASTVNTHSDAHWSWGYVPYEVFMVETISPMGVVMGTSAPDSGYSMDNLSPAIPTAFTGMRSAGATHLTWSASPEPDFATYRLYRGTTAGFTPSPSNLVAELTSPGFVDGAPANSFYKLAAVDVHGNASGEALLAPTQTLDAPAAAPTLAFAPVSPNPARGSVSLAFTLPVASHVRLAVYDAQGRVTRTVVDGEKPAGPNEFQWNLRDGEGRALAPGLYLARLSTPAGTLVRRFAVVE